MVVDLRVNHGGVLTSFADAIPTVDLGVGPTELSTVQVILDTETVIGNYSDNPIGLDSDLIAVTPCDPTVIKGFFVDNSGSVWQECISTTGAGTPVVYTHEQTVAASTWTVTHNLGHLPYSVIVYVANQEVEAFVNNLSINVAEICFTTPFTGTAIFT